MGRKDMKAKLRIIVGLLVIGIALMIAPAMAAESGEAAVTGNPASYVSISLTNSSINLALDAAASPAYNYTAYIVISSNGPFALKGEDNSARSAEQGKGFMQNYTIGSTYVATPFTNLTNRLSFAGDSNSTYGTITAAAANHFSGPAVDFWTGTPVSQPQLLTSTFSQIVTGTNYRLPTGYYYRIDLLYTIYAT